MQPGFTHHRDREMRVHVHVHHTVALLPEGSHSTMAQTGVSGPVVVDGESFSDALFASAGQG